jgi:hypothetical protein
VNYFYVIFVPFQKLFHSFYVLLELVVVVVVVLVVVL